jgi:hypothetical protein
MTSSNISMTTAVQYCMNHQIIDQAIQQEKYVECIEPLNETSVKCQGCFYNVYCSSECKTMHRKWHEGSGECKKIFFDGFRLELNGLFNEIHLLDILGAFGDVIWIPDSAKEVIKFNGLALQSMPIEFGRNKDFVLTAVKQCGLALQFASPALQDDEEVVLAAVRKDGNALQFASDNMKNNLRVVMQAVYSNYDAHKYASAELQSSQEFKKALDDEADYRFSSDYDFGGIDAVEPGYFSIHSIVGDSIRSFFKNLFNF